MPDRSAGAAAPAIHFEHVSKVYKLFGSRQEQVMDSLGLTKMLPMAQRPKFGEFHALRDVSFTINFGERIGVIGRNGAGKTTMLRLITQNFAPTAGDVGVHGSVQALMQLGLGFHPEFTGHENIVASLNYNGLVGDEFKQALREVTEFVELGEFLHQPVKAYSLGMQARLQFAAATAIRPDILIVDEVMGAGDGYFAAKSAHRMKKLALSGCTLLLVSHATNEILRFCERVIWMHQGSVLMDGPALDVVRVYEAYIEELNFKMRKQTEALWADVDAKRELLHHPEHAKPAETVVTPAEAILAPAEAVEAPPETVVAPAEAVEAVVANESTPETITETVNVVDIQPAQDTDDEVETVGAPTEGWRRDLFGALLFGPGSETNDAVDRWPGERGLKIARVRLLDGTGRFCDRAQSGEPLQIEISVVAEEQGDFRFRVSILFMSLEGVGVTRNFSPYYETTLAPGEMATFKLRLPEVLLTGGEFVFSCALFKHFDMVDSSTAIRYDLLARCFRLKVDGRLASDPGLFHQPGEWDETATVRRAPVRARA